MQLQEIFLAVDWIITPPPKYLVFDKTQEYKSALAPSFRYSFILLIQIEG